MVTLLSAALAATLRAVPGSIVDESITNAFGLIAFKIPRAPVYTSSTCGDDGNMVTKISTSYIIHHTHIQICIHSLGRSMDDMIERTLATSYGSLATLAVKPLEVAVATTLAAASFDKSNTTYSDNDHSTS